MDNDSSLCLWLCFQIYVEIERARLTRTLAKIKEDQGDISEAATILQELQVRLTLHGAVISYQFLSADCNNSSALAMEL